MTSIFQNSTQQIDRSKSAQEKSALKRYLDRSSDREKTVEDLKIMTPIEVDTAARVEVRRGLIDARDGMALERLIGESDLFPISYFDTALLVSKSVCKIEVHDQIGRVLGYGTGFLVSPSLLMTNHHVLAQADIARFSIAQFNYQIDTHLMPLPVKSFRLDPDRFFLADERLDFAIVAIEPETNDGARISDFGFLRLIAGTGKALKGEYVSIIQHPMGAPKAVAIRENRIIDCFEYYLHYETDTEPGSSGSPVFNDDWTVVALHHSGVPDPNDKDKYVANEGIRISSIMNFLEVEGEALDAGKRGLLDEMFKSSLTEDETTDASTEMEIDALEKEWYENVSGYDELFLGSDFAVPLPQLSEDLREDIAELEDGGSVLNYTHFSVVMNKSRRLAYFTAVNIDGARRKDIKRSKDNWYFDPRISRDNQCGPDIYKGNDLDLGHLVRRLDPVWGNDASEANEDTFHFTNCSPQHKNLNRTKWLHLEDYILENAGKHDIRVSVFTGPVFRDDDLLYRGVQIPAEFWKVVVMVITGSQDRLSATAYLQTQKNLIDDLEFAYGKCKSYQVPIKKIENLTGLDFGELGSHDPMANIESVIGRAIERPSDIVL